MGGEWPTPMYSPTRSLTPWSTNTTSVGQLDLTKKKLFDLT